MDSGIDFDPQAPAGISASPREDPSPGGDGSQAFPLRGKYSEMDAPGAAEMKLPAPLGSYHLTHLPPARILPIELKALDLFSCLGWDYLQTPCLIQTLSKPQAVGFHVILQSFKHFITASFLES